jgi:hypothetical protein
MADHLPTKRAKAHEKFSEFLLFVIARGAKRTVAIQLNLDCSHTSPPPIEVFVGNTYYVYIITNRRNGTLYTGVTNSLELPNLAA